MVLGTTKGMIICGQQPRQLFDMAADITIRFSSDGLGETLSLALDDAEIMISVDFSSVAKVIKKERKKHGR